MYNITTMCSVQASPSVFTSKSQS